MYWSTALSHRKVFLVIPLIVLNREILVSTVDLLLKLRGYRAFLKPIVYAEVPSHSTINFLFPNVER